MNGEEVSPTKVGRSQSDGLLDSSFHSMGGSLGGGQTDTLVRDRSQTPEMCRRSQAEANADAGTSPQGKSEIVFHYQNAEDQIICALATSIRFRIPRMVLLSTKNKVCQ